MNNSPQDLISIVIPVYNAKSFLKDTIATVLAQSYKNWELIFIDDCSTDNSRAIIEDNLERYNNVFLYSTESNSGVAAARNIGILKARGRYIAFLDADDLWQPRKLDEQLSFMKLNGYAFTFTGYEFADAEGIPNGKKVRMPLKLDRRTALKNTVIWTSTVMIDIQQVPKKHIRMPDLRYGEDAITWWHILTIVDYAYSIDRVLSYYRRTSNTLSANKVHAATKKWELYRKHVGLSFTYSLYCYSYSMLRALTKRV